MKNEQLKNYKIFEDLDDDQLKKLHPIIEKEKIEAGKRFIVEGDEGNSMIGQHRGESMKSQL